MSNVVISRRCNLSCPYCFAGEFMQEQRAESDSVFISSADFERKLAFLKQSGITDLRLIGGEPTLHPEIQALITLGREHGFHVLIFTHGLLSDSLCDFLQDFSEQECTLLVNMNSQHCNQPDFSSLNEKRLSVLTRLPHLTAPGVNIYSPDFELESVFAAIDQSGCRPVIRLGLAHPTLNGSNAALHQKYYRFVGERIVSYLPAAQKRGVHFEFDCGFVRCMFTDEELDALEEIGIHPHFECSPILDLDLGEDVFHCFSLTEVFKQSLDVLVPAKKLRDNMIEEAQLFRQAGVFPSCSNCEEKKNGTCSGGCLAATLQRFKLALI